jgi:hypothetical protein
LQDEGFTAAQAASIILDGVRSGAWRILVGAEAKMLDAPGLLAGRRKMARDLRVDAYPVERAREYRHGGRAHLAAVRGRARVVAALTGGDGAEDEPQNEHERPDDVHRTCQFITGLFARAADNRDCPPSAEALRRAATPLT